MSMQDVATGVALWRQVADGIERGIAEGRFAPGEKLPGEMEIAETYRVNRHTVRRALATLAERSGRIVLTSMVGFAVMDLHDRLLMLLARAAKRWALIDGYAERALDVARRLGSPVWAARVRADWADALEARASAAESSHPHATAAKPPTAQAEHARADGDHSSSQRANQ